MADYPGQMPKSDPRWRNTTLYSIAGWMSSWYGWEGEEIGTAFGGYFRFDHKDGHVEGEIVDTWGSAKIAGSLRENMLMFSKTYIYKTSKQTARGAIEYRFVRNGDAWYGQFLLQSGTFGKAACKITPVVEDAFALMVGPPKLQF